MNATKILEHEQLAPGVLVARYADMVALVEAAHPGASRHLWVRQTAHGRRYHDALGLVVTVTGAVR